MSVTVKNILVFRISTSTVLNKFYFHISKNYFTYFNTPFYNWYSIFSYNTL